MSYRHVNRPYCINIPAHLLEVLWYSGSWMTHQQLARAIGKPYLEWHDSQYLRDFMRAGFVEGRRVPDGKRRPVWEYRVMKG